MRPICGVLLLLKSENERLKTSQAEYQIDFVRLASLLTHWKTMNSPSGEPEPRRIRRGSLL